MVDDWSKCFGFEITSLNRRRTKVVVYRNCQCFVSRQTKNEQIWRRQYETWQIIITLASLGRIVKTAINTVRLLLKNYFSPIADNGVVFEFYGSPDTNTSSFSQFSLEPLS